MCSVTRLILAGTFGIYIDANILSGSSKGHIMFISLADLARGEKYYHSCYEDDSFKLLRLLL
jgi:hypothetical protein